MEKERNVDGTAMRATIDRNGVRVPDPDRLAIIDRGFDALLEALQASRWELRLPLVEAAETIGASLAQGGKLLICGNGGSAAEAQHFAAELVGRFKVPGRRALPALALTADTAVLTAWSNDASYEDVFARQVEAFGASNDVLVGLSIRSFAQRHPGLQGGQSPRAHLRGNPRRERRRSTRPCEGFDRGAEIGYAANSGDAHAGRAPAL
jgi:hypothetical protein